MALEEIPTGLDHLLRSKGVSCSLCYAAEHSGRAVTVINARQRLVNAFNLYFEHVVVIGIVP